MRNDFTAIIERDGEWYIAYCPEIPGANGQGRTKDEARESLAERLSLFSKTAEKMVSTDFLRRHPRDRYNQVKRSTLLLHLRRYGCYLKREGSNHSLWTNPNTGAIEAVPRHTEIPHRLVRKNLP